MKTPKKSAKKEKLDPRVEYIYEKEIEFICPRRGKIKQKVKIKRFKTLQEMAEKHLVNSGDFLDDLDKKDDGLSIYKEELPEE